MNKTYDFPPKQNLNTPPPPPPSVFDDDDSDARSSATSLASNICDFRVINGRTYHATVGTAEAWQPNDNIPYHVMKKSHFLNKLVLGNKLFLAPITTDVQNVLDVGTGTGNWAI